MTKKSSYVSKF